MFAPNFLLGVIEPFNYVNDVYDISRGVFGFTVNPGICVKFLTFNYDMNDLGLPQPKTERVFLISVRVF